MDGQQTDPAPLPADSIGRRGPLGALLRLSRSRWTRAGLLICAVGLAVFAVGRNWTAVSADLQHIGWGRSVVSAVPMALALACGMLSWRRVLAGLGSPLSSRVGGQIYFVGQLGKYLPGALWPVLTQMELGSDHQVPRRRSVAALLIAVLISLVCGFGIGSVVAIVKLGAEHRWWWLTLVAVPVGAALLIPRVLWALLSRVPVIRNGPAVEQRMSGRTMMAAVGWSLAGWVLYGLHVALLAALAAPGRFGPALLLGIGGYALAWCAGMVAFLLPAGAGARDGVLVLMLSSSIPTSAAIAIAVVSRVVTTIADLSLAGAAVLITQRSKYRTGHVKANVTEAG